MRDVSAWRESARVPVARWLVLEAGPNASTDYYVRARLTLGDPSLPVVYRSLGSRPKPGELAHGTFVIVVRTLDPRWAYALARAADELAGLAYFMDDDLWDPWSYAGLPLGYRWRLARGALLYRAWLRARISHLWVSTPALATKYAASKATVLPPLPLLPVVAPARVFRPTAERIRVVYHGSRAHRAEMRWLVPILADVLAACPDVEFEAIGGAEVRSIFRGLPRTRVLDPMSWPEYRRHGESTDAHIGLAPLLPSRFNEGRSATKVFDHARLAAVGIYSSPGPYDEAVRDQENGLLLPLDRARWTREIVALASDRARLDRMRRAVLTDTDR